METETKEAAAGCPGLMDEKKNPQHAGGMKKIILGYINDVVSVFMSELFFFYMHLLMEHIKIPLKCWTLVLHSH